MKIDRYHTFGLRKPWLEGFLEQGEEWLMNNNLGPKQKDAMNKYLLDAQLIEVPKNSKQKKLTDLYSLLSQLLNRDENTVWQVVWVNLCTNSDLFRWYVKAIPWGSVWSKEELKHRIMEDAKAKSRTAQNAINALVNTFENTFEKSPLGKWFGECVDKKRKIYKKKGTDDVSLWAVGYALYKLKEMKNWRTTSVREIYETLEAGPYAWFGISKDRFKQILIGLRDRNLLSVDLVADLDNIHFYDDINPLEILRYAVKEIY